jgi:hypothetical protein
MGTTAEKLQKILTSKADIKTAIEDHDVSVGDAPLAGYADKIRAIKSRETTSQSYCVGRWPSWADNNPDATRVDGDAALALDWYPVLVDMSAVEGEMSKRPVGWLMRNNWLRFDDGSFAPTVGITEQQRAECDVALWLDEQLEQQYCEAGGFDAADFYAQYGMTQKLYDSNGKEVRILRPWETTETKYSIFIARRDTVYLIDDETGADGSTLRGIVADEGKVDGIKPTHRLVPTGIAAGPCTELEGQLRCFFFAYPTGEVGCGGLLPGGTYTGEDGELFAGDGTYPRVLDNDVEGANGYYPNDDGKGVNQAKNAKMARASNHDPAMPYPVAEGGWHSWSVFVASLEAAYGTKDIHSPSRFSGGICANDSSNNETNWHNNGGVRLKLTTATAWAYYMWNASNHPIYPKSGNRVNLSELINRYGPKMYCLEGQMALSMAAEQGVQPGQTFEFYGHEYSYLSPTGATPLLAGRMNARLYRTRRMQIGGYTSSRAAATWDVEVRLRCPVAEGMNLCGDIFVYMGGGHELVTTYVRSAHKVRSYLECDQTKWKDINHTVQQSADFDFMADYERLEDGRVEANQYVMRRCPYGTWRQRDGVNIATGECAYHWEAALGTSSGVRYRAGVRVRGNAHNVASARSVSSNALASICSAAFAPSAQVLMDIEGATATQSQ